MLHSPKTRAAQTAEAIAAYLPDARVDVTDLLDDRTAVPSPERVHDYPAHRHAWLAEVPEAERDADGRRMTHAWRGLSAPDPDPDREGATLLVTHAFVVGWFAREVLNAPPAAWLQLMPVANAGLTIIGSDRYGVRTIELFNATDHLDPQRR